jgi:CheY-like chemotaxis protein
MRVLISPYLLAYLLAILKAFHHSISFVFGGRFDAWACWWRHPMAYVAASKLSLATHLMLMHTSTGTLIQRVIVVDQDVETVRLIAELLKDEGYAPLCYPSWLLSVACIAQAQASLLILELGPGDPSPELDLLTELRQHSYIHSLPVIVISTDQRLLARMAQPLHDLDCIALAKPFELDDFFSSVRESLHASRASVQRLTC